MPPATTPSKNTPAPASTVVPPVKVVEPAGSNVKVALVGATPVAVITEPAPVVETVVKDDSCKRFHPVYLTKAEIKLISQVSLTAIINNNHEGEIRCGWKERPEPTGD